MSKPQEPRNAAAGKRQQAYLKKHRQAAAAVFSTENLTNKNEDYMYQLNKQLDRANVDYTKKQELLQQTLTAIQQGQKTGRTARAMFGTPTQHAHDLLHPKKKDAATTAADQPLWMLAADNALIFFAIFTGMFALMAWFSPAAMAVKNYGSSGLTAIVIVAILGGFIFGYVAKTMLPQRGKNGKRVRKPLWQRVLIVVGGLVAWMFVYFVANYFPNAINPRPNRVVYTVLALLGLAADIWYRHQFHVSGIFGSTQQRQRQNSRN